MFAPQRQAEILSDLDRFGSVSVARLAERFAVTDETIRRDLVKLERSGRLMRTHGGAVSLGLDQREPPFAQRSETNADAKRAIAARAADQIRPGDVVAIDASTTGLELAKRLRDSPQLAPITVVSNGLDAVRWLADSAGVRVVSTGGEFDAAGACFVGPIAEATLRQFAFRRAFVSCRAYDPERGASESCPTHASIKRLMMAQAEGTCLLVDATKLGQRAACYFAAPSEFAAVFTDAESATTAAG